MEQYGRFPCDDCWLSQGFKKSHKAIDLGWLTKYGAKRPVKAWKSGKVITNSVDSAGGVYVVMEHVNGAKKHWSAYWHLVKGSVKVKKGQTIKQGDVIGTRGNTGVSTGVHLHFMLTKEISASVKYTYANLEKYAVNPLPLCYVFDGQHISIDGVKKKPAEVVQEAPEPAERNTAINQVEVVADALRVRLLPSLKADIWCTCKKGIFNVLEAKDADGYTWYKIAADRWIASKEGEWTRYLASTAANKDQQIKELQAQLNVANQKIEAVRKAIL